MATQWNVGPSGPVGLIYSSLGFVMGCCGVDAQQQPEVFDDLRILEDAALTQMRLNK